ncbi:MAG: hypothetical protein HYX72_09460 [Acidobacteria bacterium]|nr:hypothetical protein [Acidobacteriota bacterium]
MLKGNFFDVIPSAPRNSVLEFVALKKSRFFSAAKRPGFSVSQQPATEKTSIPGGVILLIERGWVDRSTNDGYVSRKLANKWHGRPEH